jgi:putative SOS response-associated peptidase YedK
MCGRFTLTSSQEQIAAILPGLVLDEPPAPRYNIAPTQPIAAVLNDDSRRVTPVRWGLIPSWAKDPAIGGRMINARAETVHEKPSFKRPLRRQRCMILADGFYEWKAVAGQRAKTPMYIHLRDGRPFAFAGLWDRWRGPDGHPLTTATIITTTANALMETIHDRMPVVLDVSYYDTWLSPDEPPVETLLECLRPYPAEEMDAYAVSTKVNKPSHDAADCVAPAPDA